MQRRRYLRAVAGLSTAGVGGCVGRFGAEPGGEDPTPSPTPTGPTTLAAGSQTVSVARPRVRASITSAATHLDVHDEPGMQFLVLDADGGSTLLEDLSLSLRADEEVVAAEPTLVGWPESRRHNAIGFAVSVAEYGRLVLRLEADGEVDEWPLPGEIVSTLAVAPAFDVSSLSVPDRVRHGETFEASFTVENRGDRAGRFLAEFGHGFISDTDEVALEVPVGARRSHVEHIDPPYGPDTDAVPVVLQWRLDARRVTVPVATGSGG